MKHPEAMARLPPLTRLSDPVFSPDCAAAYGEALDALDAARVPVMLGGALAFNAYTGIWRDTKDLDLFLRAEDAQAALQALERAGFEPEVVYESWLAKAWKGDVFVDLIWRNANGLFPVTREWFEHASPRRILDRDALVLPIEELILSKMMVGGRYRFDGADIVHLLYAGSHAIDWDRLADGAGEHVGLLLAYLHMYRWGYPEAAGRVPERVLADYARRAEEATTRSSYGPLRALLMDIQSFQVDVQGWGFPDPHLKVLEEIFGDATGRA